MTREQTIEKLKTLYTNAVAAMLRADACDDDESAKVMTEYAETLDSAITELQTDGDCISRADAIRVASGYCHPANVAKELAKLPSVQPEPSTEIQEILDYLDTTLHPIVSPDNWYVYSELHDMISRLPSVQPEVIRCRDCRFNTYSKKCLNPDSFFLVPADDFYCGYAERRTDERTD